MRDNKTRLENSCTTEIRTFAGRDLSHSDFCERPAYYFDINFLSAVYGSIDLEIDKFHNIDGSMKGKLYC